MPENKFQNQDDIAQENKALKEDVLKKPQDRKNRRRMVFYIVLAVTATLSFFIVAFTAFFRVDHIEINGNEKYSAEDIIKASGIEMDTPLYAFGSLSVERVILTELPYIEEVDVLRKLPSTVAITVTEEKPVFYTKVNDDYYIVSDDFTVLERTKSLPAESLILLKTGYVASCNVGKELSFDEEKLLYSLKTLWQTLKNYNFSQNIKYIEALNRFDIYFGYNDKLRVYFGKAEDSEAKIRFFSKILDYIYEDQNGILDISNKKEATFSSETE